MARGSRIGINLDIFDSFGRKRMEPQKKSQPKKPINVYRATRQLERLIPRSSFWEKMWW